MLAEGGRPDRVDRRGTGVRRAPEAGARALAALAGSRRGCAELGRARHHLERVGVRSAFAVDLALHLSRQPTTGAGRGLVRPVAASAGYALDVLLHGGVLDWSGRRSGRENGEQH